MKVVLLNGGFGTQLTHDIIVDTISTKLNKKSTDAKAGAGGVGPYTLTPPEP
jgi:hypothetical protein